MKKKVKKLMSEIENYGILFTPDQWEYVEGQLKRSYLTGKIEGIRESVAIKNKL